jgi:electron transport complex protein RnfA
MGELFQILISAMLINNFTLVLFLGLCPFMGVSAKVGTALRMGGANIFVLVITSMTASFLNAYILPFAPYLRVISFIVVIASLVQIVETVIKKVSPTLFRELGIFLPLITTNCAILGLAIFQTNKILAGSLSLAFMGFAGLFSS